MNRTTQPRNCPLCEAMCGLIVDADPMAGVAFTARGDKDDPLSHGYVCPKSQAVLGLRTDPDRLRRPLRRVGGEFQEIGWDEAIAEGCDRLNAIRRTDGNDAIGFYYGNPLGHRPNLALYMSALAAALATRQTYWVGPIDQAPRLLSCLLMFGSSVYRPVPDLDRSLCMVIVGANPLVSNGSLVVAPGFRRRLDALKSRGGKLIVIDPRRTETAAIADQYIAIRPGADAALMLAMVNVLFAERLVKLGACEGLVKGIDTLRAAAERMPAERAALACGISAEDIRALARTIAGAPSAVVYGRMGTCVQAFGSVTNWLMDCINVLTGNLDRPGGAMFNPGVPLSTRAHVGGLPPGRWYSRVRGLPEFMGMMPSAVLAEELLTPGAGQLRGFVMLAGNPVLSNPNGRAIAEGLSGLDFLLSIDIYLNETSRFADLVLPSRDYLEESDFPGSTAASMVRHYVKWSPPLFPPSDGIPSDAELMVRLAAGLRGVSEETIEEEMLTRMLDMARTRGRPECRGMPEAEMRAALNIPSGGDRLFDIMLRAGPYGDAFGRVEGGLTLDVLRNHPHGMDFGALRPELPSILGTADRLIDLAPDLLMRDLERLHQFTDRPAGEGLLLIGRRDVRSKNSWLHNVNSLAKGKERCTLLLHPNDAAAHGIRDGEQVAVRGSGHNLVVPAQVTDEMMPGVVSLPHGFGHDAPGARLAVAAARPGASANDIIPDYLLDVPSASSVLNGVPVTLAIAKRATA